jgi:hypothetical protein
MLRHCELNGWSRADDLCGSSIMTKGTTRTAVALAAFDDGGRLRAAILALAGIGIPRDEAGIAALATTIAIMRHQVMQDADAPPLAAILDNVEPLAVMVRNVAVHVSRGDFWPSLACFGATPDADPFTAPWMTPRMRIDLARHISNGAAVLGVRAATIEQRKRCTRILLERSSHRVHTHEFRQ